jgi:cytochrome P450
VAVELNGFIPFTLAMVSFLPSELADMHMRHAIASAEPFLPPPALLVFCHVGPIVRIAPNLCSVSDPSDLKVVYGGKFPKSTSYSHKHIDGVEHMLILREPKAVKARRGLLLPLFQRSNLDAFLPELERYTSILLRQLEAEQKAYGNVDVFRWFRLVAFDIIGMSPTSVLYAFDLVFDRPLSLRNLMYTSQVCWHMEWTWR